MSFLDRVKSGIAAFSQKSTGTAGPLPPSWPMNWFQVGLPTHGRNSANSAVEACVAAYAQTIAQCPLGHFRIKKDGSYEQIRDSSVASILMKPNDFQTRSDFMNNLVYSILYQGNGYFFSHDDPKKADRVYLLNPRQTTPELVSETGDIYYNTGGQFAEIAGINQQVRIPSRFVGHVRLYTPNSPIIGVSPITAAISSVSANDAITNHQAAFFENMRRPSGVLTTENKLTREQITMLREAWDDQSAKMNSGGVPILSNGLNWQALSITSQDAQLIEAWRMTVEDISRVFRIPKIIINSMENSTFSNVEQLMSFWLSSGLGFMVDAIEQTLAAFFRLPADEKIECDTDVLLRADLEGRVNAYGSAVTKGLMSPNEGRKVFRLPPVEGGDEPRVQQQMVPLSWRPPEDKGISGNPNNGNQPSEGEDGEDDEDGEKGLSETLLKILLDTSFADSLKKVQTSNVKKAEDEQIAA